MILSHFFSSSSCFRPGCTSDELFKFQCPETSSPHEHSRHPDPDGILNHCYIHFNTNLHLYFQIALCSSCVQRAKPDVTLARQEPCSTQTACPVRLRTRQKALVSSSTMKLSLNLCQLQLQFYLPPFKQVSITDSLTYSRLWYLKVVLPVKKVVEGQVGLNRSADSPQATLPPSRDSLTLSLKRSFLNNFQICRILARIKVYVAYLLEKVYNRNVSQMTFQVLDKMHQHLVKMLHPLARVHHQEVVFQLQDQDDLKLQLLLITVLLSLQEFKERTGKLSSTT